MKNTRKGFTLVELLVVIAILAILATVSVVGYTSFINRANDSNAATELHQIQSYINADLMADNKWEYTAENGTKVVVVKKSTGLAVMEGAQNLAEAINNCPDFEGLGHFEIAENGEDLEYTASNGKGKAVWADIVYTCEHARTTTTTTVDANCTEAGSTTVTCDDCDATISTTPIEALGHLDENGDSICERPNCGHTHEGGTATCKAKAECTVCGEAYGSLAAHDKKTTVAGTNATCTATGLTEGKKCSVCGTPTVEQEEIPMIPHSAGSNGKCSCGASLVYLVVGPWDVSGDDERYTVYYFDDNGNNGWADMKATGEAGVYEAYVPNGYTKISFCRMDGSIAENGWTNNNPFWNQTEDLTVTAGGRFTIVDPWGNEANQKKATGTWGTVLYLKPNSNWTQANARFAAYFFNDDKNIKIWLDMTDYNNDGTYEVIAPNVEWVKVIFCRMNPETTANNWDNKWDETNNLTVPDGKNLYTVAAGAWSNGSGSWSTK